MISYGTRWSGKPFSQPKTCLSKRQLLVLALIFMPQKINLSHMTFEYEHLLPTDFSPSSRVWVYQSSRLLTISEALTIEDLLQEFLANWKSHGAPVKGFANLFFGQFLIIMADESMVKVGGCSTDSSVHLVQQIEALCKVNMFDRQNLAFVIKNKVEILPLPQLTYAIQNNFVQPNTLYFNNLVATKQALLTEWIIPAKQSWLGKKLTSVTI
jgi:hypothetical protein